MQRRTRTSQRLWSWWATIPGLASTPSVRRACVLAEANARERRDRSSGEAPVAPARLLAVAVVRADVRLGDDHDDVPRVESTLRAGGPGGRGRDDARSRASRTAHRGRDAFGGVGASLGNRRARGAARRAQPDDPEHPGSVT